MIVSFRHKGLEDFFCTLGLSVEDAADRLGVSSTMLADVLDGRTPMTVDLAIRLELAGVSTARCWLALQSQYDLAQAYGKPPPPVKALAA